MSKSNVFESDLQKLVFWGRPIAGLADNAVSPSTVLYVSLHTADPGEAGDQSTDECTYGSYSRVPVPRDDTGWTITDSTVSPAANIDFPPATSGSETATYAGIGLAAAGAGKVLYAGPLSPEIVITPGVTPRIRDTSTLTED